MNKENFFKVEFKSFLDDKTIFVEQISYHNSGFQLHTNPNSNNSENK